MTRWVYGPAELHGYHHHGGYVVGRQEDQGGPHITSPIALTQDADFAAAIVRSLNAMGVQPGTRGLAPAARHFVVTARDHIELMDRLDNLAESGWRVVNYAAVVRAASAGPRDVLTSRLVELGVRPDTVVEYSALMVREG